MSQSATNLYNLLPEFIRRYDADQGFPLNALLDAAQEQADLVYKDISRLWDNFFVETCDPWVLPYIADLIGLTLIADDAANNRRDVARTIAYRRRKGTPGQLEKLASDVTGYDCRGVEFFERLQWTQSMIHLKPQTLWTADVRDLGAMGRVGAAFDRTCHTADLRPSTQRQGWYNIRKLGFFLWRLRAIPLHKAEAARAPAPAPAGAFHFNVLGQPEPLFQSPAPLERGADADWPRATELRITSPISPLQFREAPDEYRQEHTGFTIYKNDSARNALAVIPANLCAWTPPPNGKIAVDVRLGRLLFAADITPQPSDLITTDHCFGFSGYMGGGGYDRMSTLSPLPGESADVVHVSKTGSVTSIAAALTQLALSTAALRVVHVDDSRTYSEALQLPATFDKLVIQAADGQRPVILLQGAGTTFTGPASGKQLCLRGLLFTGAGRALMLPAGVETYTLEHCSVDPGGGVASDGVNMRSAGVIITVPAPATGVTLRITQSLVGALSLPQTMECLAVADSICDGQQFPGARILGGGPPATVLRSTMFGAFECYRLEASESIFQQLTCATRRQEGCVRFCYFAPGSLVPRRFQCAPEGPPPVFTSTLFGHPAYAQLALNCTPAIAAGSEDGGEMGVWNSLGGPRRLAHLRLRLMEYLPAGLAPVFVFAT